MWALANVAPFNHDHDGSRLGPVIPANLLYRDFTVSHCLGCFTSTIDNFHADKARDYQLNLIFLFVVLFTLSIGVNVYCNGGASQALPPLRSLIRISPSSSSHIPRTATSCCTPRSPSFNPKNFHGQVLACSSVSALWCQMSCSHSSPCACQSSRLYVR